MNIAIGSLRIKQNNLDFVYLSTGISEVLNILNVSVRCGLSCGFVNVFVDFTVSFMVISRYFNLKAASYSIQSL